MTVRQVCRVGIVLLICLGALLPAACTCASPERRRRWVGTSRADGMAYRYMRFTGTEEDRVRVEAGQTWVLAYAATVERGTLTVQVQAPDGSTLWEATLDAGADEQQVELTAAETGAHRVRVRGDETQGSFALSWTVR